MKKNVYNKWYWLMAVFVVMLTFFGGSLAYWQWQTSTEQHTAINFTIEKQFSCSVDGGGDISSNDAYLAPTSCTNSKYAIQKTIVASANIDSNNVAVLMDVWLDVNSIDQELSSSENFRYALTTDPTSCTNNVISEGRFTETTAPLINGDLYLTSGSKTYYLYVWLDAAETNPNTMDKKFNLSLNGVCTNKDIVLPEQRLTPGTYTSYDGIHTINVGSDNAITYDNAYALTRSNANNDYVITGALGTDSKSSTFYMINNTTLVNSTTVSYTENSETVNLNGYTVFKTNSIPNVDSHGIFEVWRNDDKVNSYADFQSAVDAAYDGDTIKIVQSFTSDAGIYINKNLIIDGQNNYMYRSSSSNTAIVIEDGVDVTISNLTIDGGAVNFKIDYDNLTYTGGKAPLQSGTLEKDPKLNLPAVISKGDNLTIVNSGINNNYTTSTGAGLLIIDGLVTINNSRFKHNYATKGAAIYAGRTFYSNETTYPVSTINITDSNFDNNYSTSDGGAMFIYNTSNLNILNSNFIKNTTYNAKGGVLYGGQKGLASNLYGSEGHAKGLPPMNLYIEDSLFEGNIAGNDGYAMEVSDVSFNIVNTTFNANRGLQTTNGGSVGTISYYSYREDTEQQGYLKGCSFNGNDGPASVFGDHGTRVKIIVEDCEFNENSGNSDFIIYSANAEFRNCNFNNEKTKKSVIDVRPRHPDISTDVFEQPNILLENITFTNSYAQADILIRRHGHDTNLNTAAVTLAGETNGEIHLWDNNYLTLDGVHTGNIYIDSTTASSNYTKNSGATLNGSLYKLDGTYTFDLNYPGNNQLYPDVKYLYLEANKTYTTSELLQIHQITKNGYDLEYYTTSQLKTAWDFTPTAHASIYGKWVSQ